MTKTQAAILKSLTLQFGTVKARGIIPMFAVGAIDFRSFRGLIDRGAVKIDQYGRYMLVK